MPTGRQTETAQDKANRAARALREALAMTGIRAPVLLTGETTSMGTPRVGLGGLDADAALELAEWIETKARTS